ncbi:MAG: peptidyl-tRNA hydrolase, family [Thermotogaceae bacterium]|nr:peptidyl-tRNA hydrolase, family [Thermotogaceae bacterium]
MKRIAMIGLGNPGPQYVSTRHNAGFLSLDEFIRRYAVIQKEENKKTYQLYQCIMEGIKVYLLKPMTYMNLSGIAVREFVQKTGLETEELIVIYDDVSLELGRIRLRKSGSAGGQKGMKNIIQELGTDEIKRIKIGIGPKTIPSLPDFVLSKFREEEHEKLEWALEQTAKAMKDIIKEDFESVMNRYNGLKWEDDDN